MRRYIVFAISLILLLGSITTVIATKNVQDFNLRGYVDATDNSNLPYRIPRLGVNADLFQYDDEALAYHLSLMEQANINWIRQYIYWDEIEAIQEAAKEREEERKRQIKERLEKEKELKEERPWFKEFWVKNQNRIKKELAIEQLNV